MKKRTIILITTLLLILQITFSAFAQDPSPTETIEPKAELSSLNYDKFPMVTGILDIRDGSGAFVSILNPNQVAITENGVSVPIQSLERLDVGVQVVVAVNLSPRFGVYYEEGTKIYEKIYSDLSAWGNELATDEYDLSFITNEGINSKHRSVPREWLRAVDLYEPDYDNGRINLDVLFTAINVASEETPREGMGKVVLYFTSIIEEQYDENLNNLVDQAISNDVVVYPIFVDSNAYLETDETLNIRRLAEQTGGEMLYFADTEKMSAIDSILAPYGEAYIFGYNSTVKTTGEHDIKVVVDNEDLNLTSNSQTMALQLDAPEPIFVDPPVEIERVVDTTPASEDGFLPIFTPVEIMIDFPDGRIRNIVRSALFVNGEIVAENFSEPFDAFEWDLIGFDETGVQVLSVEVEDELGLTGKSVETTVQLMIQSPVLRWQTMLNEYGYLITIGIAVLTGSMLLVILILSGAIGPDNRSAQRKIRKAKKQPSSSMYYEPEGIRRDSQPILQSAAKKTPSKPMEKIGNGDDPVTQHVGSLSRQEQKRKQIRKNVQVRELNLPRAILKKLNEDDQTIPGGALLIFNDVTKIGSDKTQVDCLVNEPSVQAVHAELIYSEGKFTISDMNTTAGTWVNYAPITAEGCRLEDGDLVHLGKFGFRFMLNKQFKKE